jgi:hypothetical protein
MIYSCTRFGVQRKYVPACLLQASATETQGAEASGAGSGQEEEVDVEALAAHWLDMTVTAAANEYAQAIMSIPSLSQQVGCGIRVNTRRDLSMMHALIRFGMPWHAPQHAASFFALFLCFCDVDSGLQSLVQMQQAM